MKGPEENELVIFTLEEILEQSFNNCLNVCKENNIDIKTAAYKIALERLYKNYLDIGY